MFKLGLSVACACKLSGDTHARCNIPTTKKEIHIDLEVLLVLTYSHRRCCSHASCAHVALWYSWWSLLPPHPNSIGVSDSLCLSCSNDRSSQLHTESLWVSSVPGAACRVSSSSHLVVSQSRLQADGLAGSCPSPKALWVEKPCAETGHTHNKPGCQLLWLTTTCSDGKLLFQPCQENSNPDLLHAKQAGALSPNPT